MWNWSQVNAIDGKTPSHYLNQYWPRLPMPYVVTMPQWVNMIFFYKCSETPLERPGTVVLSLENLTKVVKVGLLPCTILYKSSCWRHQMETFSALLAICAGNSPVTGEFPAQRPVKWSFDVFFDLWINGWVNNGEAGDLRCHCTHYDDTEMFISPLMTAPLFSKATVTVPLSRGFAAASYQWLNMRGNSIAKTLELRLLH